MARKNTEILLGFEDELITDKRKGQVNYMTNKIGGKPDLPNNIIFDSPICPLCQLPRPMVIQIYVPLENSNYHRTLYLFACINPNCWNTSESWICLRAQAQVEYKDTSPVGSKTSATDWCADADDWDDNNSNMNEENGNLINNIERISDEDDESCSLDESVRIGLQSLSVDDPNANTGAQGGAVGRLHSPAATAEIEGDEGEVITIDTPTFPQHDLVAILQEVTPVPQEICQNINTEQKSSILQFLPYFMSVWEEMSCSNAGYDSHVKELLQDYQKRNDDVVNLSPDSGGGAAANLMDIGLEKYEKANPAHGDTMFHHFLSKIQECPGQILRYSRDSEPPLLLYPLLEYPRQCQYCQGDLVFEFQLLPTIISKLRLSVDANPCPRLEFGTILVFTCRNSCWSGDSTMRKETIVLQKELY